MRTGYLCQGGLQDVGVEGAGTVDVLAERAAEETCWRQVRIYRERRHVLIPLKERKGLRGKTHGRWIELAQTARQTQFEEARVTHASVKHRGRRESNHMIVPNDVIVAEKLLPRRLDPAHFVGPAAAQLMQTVAQFAK